jgi:Ulp1 family protease
MGWSIIKDWKVTYSVSIYNIVKLIKLISIALDMQPQQENDIDCGIFVM